MPTYEYACTSCGKHLEVVQSMKDEPLTECAECGGRLRKVFSPIGIVFKGSGFYKTDSRGGSSKKAAAPKSDTSSDSTTTTTKSESSSGGEKAAASSTPSTSSSD
jgi:putative FmdB family regulatory protein